MHSTRENHHSHSTTTSKLVFRTTRPCFLSLSLTKAGVSLRRHPFQTYLVEIATAEHFIPLGRAPSLLFCSRGTLCQPPSVKQVSRTTRPCFLSLSLAKAGVSLRRHPFQTYLAEIATAEHFIPLGRARSLLVCSRGTLCQPPSVKQVSRTTRPSLSLTKAGVSLRRHPFQTYLAEIATAEHFIPLGRARSLLFFSSSQTVV